MADNMKSLKDLFIHEIRDLYSAETQLTEALPKMAERANDENLRGAINSHLEETRRQKERLEQIGQSFGIDVKSEEEECEAMKGLIREGREALEFQGDADVRDAAIIGAAQRVEHYEMAGYGTARNFAQRLGYNDAARTLEETLNEEKSADQKLNDIAVNQVNQKAQS